ncbi:MAG: hypothetical protein IJK84_00200 [Bacteroidales bacterium]|nr:hypothetical protein [Bacteroidales bacterium]
MKYLFFAKWYHSSKLPLSIVLITLCLIATSCGRKSPANWFDGPTEISYEALSIEYTLVHEAEMWLRDAEYWIYETVDGNRDSVIYKSDKITPADGKIVGDWFVATAKDCTVTLQVDENNTTRKRAVRVVVRDGFSELGVSIIDCIQNCKTAE